MNPKQAYSHEYEEYLNQFYNEPVRSQRNRRRDRLWREDIEREVIRYEAELQVAEVTQIMVKDNSLERKLINMISKKIKIQTYNEIKEFVNIASKYGEGLIIKKGSYTFPACSLMSLLSLVDVSDGCKIYFDEINEQEIATDFNSYFVEEDND